MKAASTRAHLRPLLSVLRRGRPDLGRFALVALIVSIGTLASLFEPWVYRAIVNDVAGVFVASPEQREIRRVEGVLSSLIPSRIHLEKSGKRIFARPLQKPRPEVHTRVLEPRTPHEAVATIVLGAVLLVMTGLLSSLCNVRADNRSTALGNRIERVYILDVFRHVLRLPLSFFTRRASGSVARQIDQSDNVAPVVHALAQEIWPDLFSLIAIVIILSTLNIQLALVILVAVPAYLVVTWHMTGRLASRMEDYYALWDDVSGRIQQTVSGIKTVLTHGTGTHEARALEETTGQAYSTYLDRNRLENRYLFLQDTIVAVSKASAVLLGGLKALDHQLTPGDVVLFLAYLDQVYQPIESLTSLYASLQQNASALTRSERLLHTRAAPGEARPPLAPGRGEIAFEKVRFGYTPERDVLHDVTFHIGPGEHVALIGPSGCGKTTLTDLIVGLYRPQHGEIRIDGQEISAVSPSSLRSAIRGVATDGAIFRMSVAENIRYGRLEATDEDVLEAARLAGLETLLARLPQGIDT